MLHPYLEHFGRLPGKRVHFRLDRGTGGTLSISVLIAFPSPTVNPPPHPKTTMMRPAVDPDEAYKQLLARVRARSDVPALLGAAGFRSVADDGTLVAYGHLSEGDSHRLRLV